LTRSFITKAAFAATVAVLSVVPAAAKAQFVLNIDGGVSIRDPQASATNPTTTGTLILDFHPTRPPRAARSARVRSASRRARSTRCRA
jgi:hypothetical protein